ncbi:hypothetical protein D3C73_1383940 [compost metagenome]
MVKYVIWSVRMELIMMTALIEIGTVLLAVLPIAWYYAALGKRISAEKKKAGRDLTSEINPFTGGR